MAYNEALALRLREALKGQKRVVEKKMFGGIGFILNGNMAVGVIKKDLIVRVSPQDNDQILKRAHARPFDFSGKPMAGWIYVEPAGFKNQADLKKWVQVGLDYAASLPKK
jgi:TfoX/Sxy family transcriptional regulator of competence genes